MGFEYAGLICLLGGIGAFFILWLHTMSNRSKTVEGEIAPGELHSAPDHQLRKSEYSLSPDQKRQVSAPAEHSTSQVISESSVLVGSDLDPQDEIDADKQDETANTHLEMAHLFFDMGDFEGALEMCQLIFDNPSASAKQIGSAQELKARC